MLAASICGCERFAIIHSIDKRGVGLGDGNRLYVPARDEGGAEARSAEHQEAEQSEYSFHLVRFIHLVMSVFLTSKHYGCL